jgi:hypothetical protein
MGILRLFDNRTLRIIFGIRRQEVACNGGNCVMRSFIGCTLHQIECNLDNPN